VLLLLVGLGLWLWASQLAADRAFERLLAGAGDVSVVFVDVETPRVGGTVKAALNDAAATSYLSEMLRSSLVVFSRDANNAKVLAETRYWADLGPTHYAYLRLSTGGVVECSLEVAEKEDHLVISFPLNTFDDPVVYLVALKMPVPPSLSSFFAQIRR
jgi:hypothetical protein